MDTQLETIAQAKSKLLDLTFQFVPKLLAATLILAAGVIVGRWVGGMLERMLRSPDPVIAVSALADSSINLCARPWVKVPDYAPASGEIKQAMVEAFRAHGISIPFPQRDVRLLERAA